MTRLRLHVLLLHGALLLFVRLTRAAGSPSGMGVEDRKVMPVQPINAASDFIGRTESPTLDEAGFKIFSDGCVFHPPPAWAWPR